MPTDLTSIGYVESKHDSWRRVDSSMGVLGLALGKLRDPHLQVDWVGDSHNRLKRQRS
jgi:hypothetical protein